MNEINDESSGLPIRDNIQITDEIKGYWNEIARWGQFFGIISFVFFGILALTLTIVLFTGAGAFLGTGMMSGLGVPVVLMSILSAAVFFIAFYHWKFGTKLRHAIKEDDNESLEIAFENFKKLYQFSGYLLIAYILFYLILLFTVGSSVGNLNNFNTQNSLLNQLYNGKYS
jgi:hypothetical protein